MPEIAIDACIFIHLRNPEFNEGSHIDKLLSQLIKDNFMLLVDSTGKIGKDYESQVIPMIKKSDDIGIQLTLLRYWMQSERRITVELKKTDQLMVAISRSLHETSEHADRAFVYVVCKKNSILVTNDDIHILSRSAELLKIARKVKSRNTDILTSLNAFTIFQGTGGAA